MTFVARVVECRAGGVLRCQRQAYDESSGRFEDEAGDPVDAVNIRSRTHVATGRLVLVHAVGGPPFPGPTYVCEV